MSSHGFEHEPDRKSKAPPPEADRAAAPLTGLELASTIGNSAMQTLARTSSAGKDTPDPDELPQPDRAAQAPEPEIVEPKEEDEAGSGR
jgi:hypothetical protein